MSEEQTAVPAFAPATTTAQVPEPEASEDSAVLTQEQEEFLSDLAALDMGEEPAFGDLSEMIETEHREQLGEWFEWPAIKGSRIHIAHMSACVDKKNELERKYREKKAIPYDRAFPPAVDERLWRESLCGTVVKGWENIPLNGYQLTFNEKNFRILISNRRFRSFVFEKARSGFREKVAESARGNS